MGALPNPDEELQWSAVREIANIGTGNAASALEAMTGRPVDLSTPRAEIVGLADFVDLVGDPEADVYGILTPVEGELGGSVLLVVPIEAAQAVTGAFGLDADSEMGASVMQELGNILTASYMNAIVKLTGLAAEPSMPQVVRDILAAVASSAVALVAEAADELIFLDTILHIGEERCDLVFVYLPDAGDVQRLLSSLGL